MARALATLALVAGCATAPAMPGASPNAPPHAWEWHSMRAQHRVTIHHGTDGHKFRGLFLARRDNGRFRVRALGPGDVTIFDVVGDPRTCRQLEGPQSSNADAILNLCNDLRSAYHLPGAKGDAEVKYDDWRTVGEYPVAWKTYVRVPANGWEVWIEVMSVELDVTIDDDALPMP